MPFYAVACGKNIGVFTNWNDCKESVNGFCILNKIKRKLLFLKQILLLALY